jgi:hypothetical protein
MRWVSRSEDEVEVEDKCDVTRLRDTAGVAELNRRRKAVSRAVWGNRGREVGQT